MLTNQVDFVIGFNTFTTARTTAIAAATQLAKVAKREQDWLGDGGVLIFSTSRVHFHELDLKVYYAVWHKLANHDQLSH